MLGGAGPTFEPRAAASAVGTGQIFAGRFDATSCVDQRFGQLFPQRWGIGARGLRLVRARCRLAPIVVDKLIFCSRLRGQALAKTQSDAVKLAGAVESQGLGGFLSRFFGQLGGSLELAGELEMTHRGQRIVSARNRSIALQHQGDAVVMATTDIGLHMGQHGRADSIVIELDGLRSPPHRSLDQARSPEQRHLPGELDGLLAGGAAQHIPGQRAIGQRQELDEPERAGRQRAQALPQHLVERCVPRRQAVGDSVTNELDDEHGMAAGLGHDGGSGQLGWRAVLGQQDLGERDRVILLETA